jgi:hypothetical protein
MHTIIVFYTLKLYNLNIVAFIIPERYIYGREKKQHRGFHKNNIVERDEEHILLVFFMLCQRNLYGMNEKSERERQKERTREKLDIQQSK